MLHLERQLLHFAILRTAYCGWPSLLGAKLTMLSEKSVAFRTAYQLATVYGLPVEVSKWSLA